MSSSRTHSTRSSVLSVAVATLAAAVAMTTLLLAAGGQPSAAAASAVDLGTAKAFSVLAGQGVTNTGPSVIGRDLGTHPNPAVTGFPPGVVLGTIHAADAVALQAKSDLTKAYNAVAAQPSDQQISSDLAGLRLTTGVYTASSTMALSGELTLDAQGDPGAIFIFQVGSGLTIASGSTVTLTNGAQACNVYWQVGSTATLGTNADFKGTILALTSITAASGADVEGRLLARNGSVTLDNNTITAPGCAPGSGGTSATPSTGPTATDSTGSGGSDGGGNGGNGNGGNGGNGNGGNGNGGGGNGGGGNGGGGSGGDGPGGDTPGQVPTVPTGFPNTGQGGSASSSLPDDAVLIGSGVLAVVLAGGLLLWWRRQTSTA